MKHWSIFLPRKSHEEERKLRRKRLDECLRNYEAETGLKAIDPNDYWYAK